MPAVYSPPSGGSLPIFVTSAHPDQIGVNAAPTTQTYAVTASSSTVAGIYSSNHVQQTDRDYAGGDTVRPKTGVWSSVLVDNNDPTWTPISIAGVGISSILRSGFNTISYGTLLAMNIQVYVHQVPSPHGNEYSLMYGVLVAGSYTAQIAGGNYWFYDHAMHGPSGQPGILSGYSLVTNNYYNGSPQFGTAVGICLQTAEKIGGQNVSMCSAGGVSLPTYPWDVGYFISGYSTGAGSGDGYTNAMQIGGLPGPWMGTGGRDYGGDFGQVARGVIVKAKRNGTTSVARLGAYVSEGTGEAGGLVLGLDTSDANRVSLSRSSAGNAALRGNLAVTGGITGVSSGLTVPHGGVIYQALSPGTAIANSAAQASLLAGVTTSQGSLTIPANSLTVGKVLRPVFWGTGAVGAAAQGMTISLSLGGTTFWSFQSTAGLGTTTVPIVWQMLSTTYFQIQAIGSSGRIIGFGWVYLPNGASVSGLTCGTNTTTQTVAWTAPVAVTIDTTAALTFDIKAQWGAATAGNTIQLLGGHITIDG